MKEQDPVRRIAVVRGQNLVPLLSSGASQPAREQPWQGVLLEQHVVGAGEIPEHEHPELCLHLQLSGTDEFEWWSDGANALEQTRPGSLILIPAGTTDRLRWSGPSERLILSIRGDRLARLAEDWGLAAAPTFGARWAMDDPAVRNLMSEMGREARSAWPLGGLYADLLTLGLETQLFRTHAIGPIRAPEAKGGLGLPMLRRAMEYINANLAEDLRLERIARELHLSESHFAHEFRASTGQTPYQYLLDQRMAKAKEVLKRTRWSVQYISELTGFGSPANFVRAFRQRVGQTPGVWRKG